jgi:outer membrane lipoprotein-sorting protein
MKIVSGIVMFVLLGVVGYAQQDAKVIAEIAASSEKAVKNSPFSAEAVSESVQTLADGNRIVRSSSSKLYRNSEGRFRREITGGSGGVLGSLYTTGQGVTILDPAGGFRYMIDPNLKTTRQVMITPRADVRVISGINEKIKSELKAAAVASGTTTIDGSAVSDKLKAEIRTAVTAAPAMAARAVIGHMIEGLAPVAMGFGTGTSSKWESRTEELGTQNIEGVDAEGSRTITTIPAGAIGNERPIEITYEKWYSRELQLVVMSKHNDPRFGEQTYRLTNIVRSEPDPSLFSPPQGYRLVTEPSGTYTYTSAAKAAAVEKAAKSAQASKARP